MACVVVDTNVLAVAENMHGEASHACVAAATSLVSRIQRGLLVAVDSDGDILREYIGTLRQARGDGPGRKLAKRLWHLRNDSAVCRSVQLTATDVPQGSFEEVPTALRDFDIDDHKFIAVALTEGSTPPIVQALDEEWWGRRRDFVLNGLDVQFICMDDLIQKYEQL